MLTARPCWGVPTSHWGGKLLTAPMSALLLLIQTGAMPTLVTLGQTTFISTLLTLGQIVLMSGLSGKPCSCLASRANRAHLWPLRQTVLVSSLLTHANCAHVCPQVNWADVCPLGFHANLAQFYLLHSCTNHDHGYLLVSCILFPSLPPNSAYAYPFDFAHFDSCLN